MSANKALALPEELVSELFNKVNGHSSLAALAAQKPVPFNGEKEFVFSMEGEAAIVGEGAAKPASEAKFEPIVIRPLKFVYQARITDEFINSADEARIGYLRAFADGFAKKIARGFDIAAMHGLNPRDKSAVTSLATNNFDGVITNKVTYDATKPDENLDAAVQAIVANECNVNGLILSAAFCAAMAKIKVNGVVQYPEFRFGGTPASFAGYRLSVNNTLTVKGTDDDAKTDHGIVGDFANAFRWGYSKNIPIEVIQYGDPDGAGRDLKQYNEVCLRSEAYIGWGILDKDAFALIQA